MAAYAFNSEDIALALRDLGANLVAGNQNVFGPTGDESLFVKVPTGGISGRVGNACGEAECTLVQLDGVDLVEVTSLSMNVLNPSTDDITADSYVRVIRLGVNWVAADGAGGGTSVAMFQSTTSIAANGEGTANIRSYDGTSWTVGTDPFTIVNPWSDSVSSGKILTAYSHSSGKWVMIQAECEDAA